MAKNDKMQTLGITTKKFDDTADWYSQVVTKSGMADYAPVKGCMIIKPLGYAVWQSVMDYFNSVIKGHGVQNAYFPMFIPESFFYKEAEHAEGFKPEVAWIEQKDDTKERYAIRPTSETIMYDTYSRWIRSWRDLPLKINQWCNICRWETQDCKIFLRSREFLWQEGHCVYETKEERDKETQIYLSEYKRLAEELLAIPVITGQKTDKEKFAGADRTFTIEGLMPDGKALQMGTSHDLSQGFAKAFGIKFAGRDDSEQIPFQNSWGFSTRLLGGIVMMHSDDKGLVLPPKVAPNKVVVIPLVFKDKKDSVLVAAKKILSDLKEFDPLFDDKWEDYSAGFRFSDWELKGIPLRIEVGPRDLENESVMVVRRDTAEKKSVKISELASFVRTELETMQNDMFTSAKKKFEENIVEVKTKEEFLKAVSSGKMALAPFTGDAEDEDFLKAETKGVTTRCIKCEATNGEKCFYTGKPAKYWIYFARNY
ncbi:proline--tRNA ligase [Candidatus Woesearchaeota archaeon]|nr:proline--tRNA ligase [Candidatus Woesearchaeota archaeon]